VRARVLSNDRERSLERAGRNRAELPNLLDPCATRACSDRCFEFGESSCVAGRGELDDPIRPVSDPSGQAQFTRDLHDVPAKPDSLHTSPNLEMYALHWRSTGEFPVLRPKSRRWSLGPSAFPASALILRL